jgi:hypothetical protein
VSHARSWFVSLVAAAATLAFAGDASERRLVRKDMKEGEVVFRIGKPDHEAFTRDVKGEPEEKTWTYFPDPRDPDTLTVVTLRAGVVVAVERKVTR